jgi:hypothetical protein
LTPLPHQNSQSCASLPNLSQEDEFEENRSEGWYIGSFDELGEVIDLLDDLNLPVRKDESTYYPKLLKVPVLNPPNEAKDGSEGHLQRTERNQMLLKGSGSRVSNLGRWIRIVMRKFRWRGRRCA